MSEPAHRSPQTRRLGTLPVTPIGLGCMGMSWAYTPWRRDEARAVRVIHQAVAAGVTHFDTSDVYGLGSNEELVGRAVKGRRDQVVIATKGGLVPRPGQARPGPRGDPSHLRAAVDASLRRLGTDRIDLYYLHRVDPAVPLTESWGALGALVSAGKLRHLGLCEVTVAQAATAHRLHPVTAVQSELSLWTRDHLPEVVPWCEAHDVGFVAFAPLGRGFLTGRLPEYTKTPGDLRADLPRFSEPARAANQPIIDTLRRVADTLTATPAQAALAWVLAQGPHVVALAGTTQPAHLRENLGALTLRLPPPARAALDRLPTPTGQRY